MIWLTKDLLKMYTLHSKLTTDRLFCQIFKSKYECVFINQPQILNRSML